MKNLAAAALSALMLLAFPATAQTLNVLLPTLAFPTDSTTSSTKGCAPDPGVQTCAVQQ